MHMTSYTTPAKGRTVIYKFLKNLKHQGVFQAVVLTEGKNIHHTLCWEVIMKIKTKAKRKGKLVQIKIC